jgi:hypothetical protein
MIEKELPEIIKEVGFDFPFDFVEDSKKIWRLEIPTVEVPIDILKWHLDIPFWSSDNGFYDLSPNRLMSNPQLSADHYRRVLNADMSYPVDFTFYKGRYKIIDGLHRLANAAFRHSQFVNGREIPLNQLLSLLNDNH